MATVVVPTQTPTAGSAHIGTKPRKRRSDARTALLFLLPNGIGFLVFTIAPVVATLVLSLYSWPLTGKATFAGLENYVLLLTKDTTFHSAIYNTLYFVAVYVPLNIAVALGVAVWLQGYGRGRRILRVIFFVPVLTPLVADSVVWSLLYTNRNGLIDSVIHGVFGVQGPEWLSDPKWAMPAIILMSVWQGFGYNMLLFTAGIHAVPETYYDAARVDGASQMADVPEHHHTADISFTLLRDRFDSYYFFSSLHAGLRADSRRAGYEQHDLGVLVVRKGVH